MCIRKILVTESSIKNIKTEDSRVYLGSKINTYKLITQSPIFFAKEE